MNLLHTFNIGSGIHCLAVAANGRTVTGSRDGKITVWDIRLRRMLRTFPTGHRLFYSLALTPDGRRAVSGGSRRLKTWDLETESLGREIDTLADDIRVLIVGPRGMCLSGHRYGGILLWDIQTGARLGSLEAGEIYTFSRIMADPDEVTAMALTADGLRLIAGSSKGFLRIWDMGTRRCIHMLHGHLLDVTGIVIPPGALRGLSASWDGTLKSWALEKDEEAIKLFQGNSMIGSLVLLKDEGEAVWGTDKGELVFWDVENMALRKLMRAHESAVSRIAVWEDDYILSASEDGTLKLWGRG